MSAKECLVLGCENKTNQGSFVGGLCSPCYTMLTTGEMGYGETYFHGMAQWIRVLEAKLDEDCICT